MSTLLAILGWTTFGLAVVVGLALDVVGLFGNWIILAAAVLAYVLSGYDYFSVPGLILLLVLALVGEAIEFLAASYGAKRFGGAKGTMVAALVGSIVGAIVGTPVPIIGTLIGACLGAFIGAVAYEYVIREKAAQHALRSGFGAAIGKIGGVFGKLLMGAVMVAAMVLMLFVD